MTHKDTHVGAISTPVTVNIDPKTADLNTEPGMAIPGPVEITAEELLNRDVQTIPCLLEPILQRVGLAAVAGSSDTGKSTWLRQFAFASGETHFLGFPIRAKHRSTSAPKTTRSQRPFCFTPSTKPAELVTPIVPGCGSCSIPTICLTNLIND